VLEPTKCMNGKLHKNHKGAGQRCVCEPCWSGNTCEVQVRVKPYLRQVFSPLTAKDQYRPQTVIVGGCEMPTELDSYFAHIKIIDPAPLKDDERNRLKNNYLDTRDLCVVRKGAPPFKEVMFQVPVATRKNALEYLVHVKHPEDNSQPLPSYVVCFCFGPECFDDAPSWYTIGTIDVVPGGDAPEQEVHNRHGYEIPPHYVNERPCGQQWMPAMDGHGIRLDSTLEKDLVYFLCMDDFTDMVGPRWIRCIDGEWFQDDAAVNPEQTENRKHWDGQLPTCRWKYDTCPRPKMQLEGGFVTVENGKARYVCQPSRIIHVDGRPWQAATYVRWCRPSGSWLPVEEPTCVADTTPQTMPSSRAAARPKPPEEQSAIASSFLEVSAEAHHVRHSKNNNGSTAMKESPQQSVQVRSYSSTATAASSSSAQTHASHAAAREALLDGVRTKITSAEITGVGPAAAIAAQGGFAVGTATAAEASDTTSDSELRSGSSGAHLSLHKWPTRFERTADAKHSFVIDKCWITLECSSDGQLPKDAAASPHFARKPDLAGGRLPWSVVFAAVASVVVSVAAMAAITKSAGSAQAAAAA